MRVAIGLLLSLVISSCQTTVSSKKIQICRLFCADKSGLYQVIVDQLRDVGCHCKSGDLMWLEIDGASGPFQERLEIDDGNIKTDKDR